MSPVWMKLPQGWDEQQWPLRRLARVLVLLHVVIAWAPLWQSSQSIPWLPSSSWPICTLSDWLMLFRDLIVSVFLNFGIKSIFSLLCDFYFTDLWCELLSRFCSRWKLINLIISISRCSLKCDLVCPFLLGSAVCNDLGVLETFKHYINSAIELQLQ